MIIFFKSTTKKSKAPEFSSLCRFSCNVQTVAEIFGGSESTTNKIAMQYASLEKTCSFLLQVHFGVTPNETNNRRT